MNNYTFNKKRTSWLHVLTTIILSTSIAFGQPILTYHYVIMEKLKPVISLNTGAIGIITEDEPDSMVQLADEFTPKKVDVTSYNTNKTFYTIDPIEKQVNIGKERTNDYDNPMDNMFTLYIPDSLDLANYRVELSYKLYGLAAANQTTKSINQNNSYGGQVLTLQSEWITVQEVIPSLQLLPGKNVIYFTRRADETYAYSIKDLKLELHADSVNKQNSIRSNVYNDFLYLQGIIGNNAVDSISFLDKKYKVNKGVVEEVISVKELDTIFFGGLNYTMFSKSQPIGIQHVVEESYTPDLSFHKLHENTAKKIVLFNETVQVFKDLDISSEKLENANVTGLEFKDLHLIGNEIVNVTSGEYLGYRIKRFDISDSTNMRLHLGYDPAKIPVGYSLKDVKAFYYDTRQNAWAQTLIDSIDTQHNKLIIPFSGDTDYINGVIKTPEMPETSSFVPTTIANMEYANPASGVVGIVPPTPNAMGTANTSFPIKIPSGRRGMQPSVGINYSSDAGNGWMGIGWNLQTPAITINTKWGVPTFDSTYESELYQLNGSDLVLLDNSNYTSPHRSETDINRLVDRQFFMRKEGSYQKIIRKGNATSGYWWIVTDKAGNKRYYGGDENGVVENAVIRTSYVGNDGNIVHWALYKTVDTYGNYVLYDYDTTLEQIGVSAEQAPIFGKGFYLSEIKYTLHNSAGNNYYKVLFRRNDYSVGNAYSARPDVIINGRNGVIQYTKDLLTEVWVQLYRNGTTENIRKYRFGYDVIAFNKTQLVEVAEYDANDDLFYSNTMEYYKEIDEAGDIIDTQDVSWNGQSDQLNNIPLTGMSGAPSAITAFTGSSLGTSRNLGYGGGLRVAIGIGFPSKSINLSIGGSFNYNHSDQKQLISFIDINGDGLPDKVFDSGGNVKYRINTGHSFGTDEYSLSNLGELSKTKANTIGVGGDVSFYAKLGLSSSTTRSRTDGYFIDVNGDGLPDVINGGLVKFNKSADDANFNRTFSNSIIGVENKITPWTISQDVLGDIDLPTKQELREDYPQFDVVKVWKAPYAGLVSVSGIAELINKNVEYNNGTPYQNEFQLTIEKATSTTTGLCNRLETGSLSEIGQTRSMSRNSIPVNKGDLLFFRTHNKDYGYGGAVEWNPVVTYSISNFNYNDENNKSGIVYNSQDDFMVIGNSPITVFEDQSGTIDFNLNPNGFNAFDYTDDIYFTVKKVRTHSYSSSNTIEYNDALNKQDNLISTIRVKYNHATGTLTGVSNLNSVSISLDTGTGTFVMYPNDPNVPEYFIYDYKEILYFSVESDSNIAWENVIWKPKVTFGTTDIRYPEVHYKIYNDNVNSTVYRINKSSLPDPQLTSGNSNEPLVKMHNNLGTIFNSNHAMLDDIPDMFFPIPVNWVIKEEVANGSTTVTKVLETYTYFIEKIEDPNPNNPGSYIYVFNYGDYVPDNYLLTREKVDEVNRIYTAFYCTFSGIDDLFTNANITLELDANVTPAQTWSPIVLANPFIVNNPNTFGQPYRGWGQFLYNGAFIFESGTNAGDFSGDHEIDMAVFSTEADYDDIQQEFEEFEDYDPEDPEAELDLPEMADTPKYAFYEVDNNNYSYYNDGLVVSMGDPENQIANEYITYGYTNSVLQASLGRFGENSIYNEYLDLSTFTTQPGYTGVKIFSRSSGSGVSAGLFDSAGSNGGSYNDSKSNTNVLNQYLDLNGDRYPDLLTSNKVQYTNTQGKLDVVQNDALGGFINSSSGDDHYLGVSVQIPNSTESTSGNSNGTKTNLNMTAGIGGGNGSSYDTAKWADINGDGLPDMVYLDKENLKIKAKLSTGYGYTEEMVWGNVAHLRTSVRNNVGISGSGGASYDPNDDTTSSWAIGGGFKTSTAERESMLMDVNGDGLPDWVYKNPEPNANNFLYLLNTGNSFSTTPLVFCNTLNLGKDVALGGNIYGTFTFDFIIYSILNVINIKLVLTPTVSFSNETNATEKMFGDIDGDGYIDILETNGSNTNLTVNKSKIGKTHLLKQVNNALGGSWQVEYTRKGNTYEMPQNRYVFSKITTHDGFTGDNNFDVINSITKVLYGEPNYDRRERAFLGFKQVTIQEMNSAGSMVHRTQINEYHNENVYVSGLLKKSSLLGGGQTLSTSRTIYNLLDPDNPVINLNATEETHYLQSNLSSELLDYSRLFVAPVKQIQYTFEGTDALMTEQNFSYDSYGNVTSYYDPGDTNNPSGIIGGEGIVTYIEYYTDAELTGIDNATGFPKKILVTSLLDGHTFKERIAEYNWHGTLSRVITKLNATENSEVTMYYDNYGNMEYMNYPDSQDASGNQFYTQLTYDNVLHTYPVNSKNAFNYEAQTTYDYLFGVPILVTDVNDKQMRTRIDDRGRVVEVTAPKELVNNSWTIRMQYENEAELTGNGSAERVDAHGSFIAIQPGDALPEDASHYALTRHNVTDNDNPGLELLTVNLIDGEGLAIQQKKRLLAGTGDQNLWLISPKQQRDDYGRVIRTYLSGYEPFDATPSVFSSYNASYGSPESTYRKYDYKDRIIKLREWVDSENVITNYSIENGMFVTETVNELQQTLKTYTDVKGRTRKTVQNNEIITRYYYNAISELLTVKDHQGYETKYKYDLIGRLLEKLHPDSGVEIYNYDKASNLISRTTSNLLAQEGEEEEEPSLPYITYDYTFNRLEAINYPGHPENKVTYEYGAYDDTEAINSNAVGRLFKQKDASGIQIFGYDEMGNISDNLRSVAVAGRHSFWYNTSWTYDSFNRIKSIIYPDGESVYYHYNVAGDLRRVTRNIGSDINISESLVGLIRYNNRGQRMFMKYGNGTYTQYSYDDLLRLDELNFNLGDTNNTFNIQKNYGYDDVNNITSITTDAPQNSMPGTAQLGGPSNHSYTYDNYNRLTEASGSYVGPDDYNTDSTPAYVRQEYTLHMEYDLNHNILNKTQTHTRGTVATYNDNIATPVTVAKTNYSLNYGGYATGVYLSSVPNEEQTFGYVQPHAPREIVEMPEENCCTEDNPTYKKTVRDYDANGNELWVKQIVGAIENEEVAGQEMTLYRNLWDEENRLRAVDLNPDDSNAHPLAIYTYDGGGQRVVRYTPGRVDVRSNGNNVSTNEWEAIMMYPSALITAKAISQPEVAPQNNSSVTYYTKHYYIGAERVASTIGTKKELGLFPENVLSSSIEASIRPQANQSVIDAGTDLVNTYTALGQTLTLTAPVIEGVDDNYQRGHDDELFDTYFYHSDHLGSSSYITGADGNITQHMEYMPFGELLVDEYLNSYNSPFKFNAKELDDESGNYYYGARYYNPKTSIWLSVDPLADNYPGWSPYNYCMQNPVNMVDPDGREVKSPPSTGVIDNKDGTYTVVAVNIKDGDNGIYLVDKNNKWNKNTSTKVGYSATLYSFYNFDEGNAEVGAKISTSDLSGGTFLTDLILNPPNLISYMKNGTKGGQYDFKVSNGEKNKQVYTETIDHYRGMLLSVNPSDKLPIYGSGRDVGNIGAGYIAALYKITWGAARLAFDGLQTKQQQGLLKTLFFYPLNKKTENLGTQAAQLWGFKLYEQLKK